MSNKITKNESQNINGGYSLEYDSSRNQWLVSGKMKINGHSTTVLRDNMPKGQNCKRFFNSRTDAVNWANQFLE